MRAFIYDTETTGTGNNDEVIQIAGFLTDIDMNIQFVINRYCFTNVPIHPGAYSAHGVDRDSLYKYSGGRYLEDVLEEMKFVRESNDIIYISYNHAFDERLMNQTLENNGVAKINFGKQLSTFKRNLPDGNYNLCAMNLLANLLNGGKKFKLMELAATRSGYTMQDLETLYARLITKLKFNLPKSGFHDALFDSFITWVLLSKYKGMMYT